ncbi:MAG: hypothetical protein KAS22_03075, partial [Candidatus Heimdallarchaeota archaeon]|nr:hypothetical protein [Candidatus Heimdallarchaeota archaeon]
MSEQIIEKGQTVRLGKVKGNLKIGKDATLIADNGIIVVDGSITSKGSFACEGDLRARSIRTKNGSVEIVGHL